MGEEGLWDLSDMVESYFRVDGQHVILFNAIP